MYTHTRQVDITAQPAEVFEVLKNPLRLLQLHPDWGDYLLEQVSAEYPVVGSSYRLRAARQDAAAFDVRVLEMQPGYRLILAAEDGLRTQHCWTVTSSPTGACLQLQESSLLDTPEACRDSEEDVRQWLDNLRNYAGLHRKGLQGVVRWALDRYVLNLRSDQRRIILALVVMQGITFLTFVAALLGLGFVSLFF